MYRRKVMTTALAILAIATAISLVTALSGSGLVTSAFALKKGSDPTSTSSSKKGMSSTSATSTGSRGKFIKCITTISGSLTRAEVDNCWDQVFGTGSASGLTLGASTSSSSSSSGHRVTSTGGSST
jgi:hypothetical protein